MDYIYNIDPYLSRSKKPEPDLSHAVQVMYVCLSQKKASLGRALQDRKQRPVLKNKTLFPNRQSLT
jgi:hypothetical protein